MTRPLCIFCSFFVLSALCVAIFFENTSKVVPLIFFGMVLLYAFFTIFKAEKKLTALLLILFSLLFATAYYLYFDDFVYSDAKETANKYSDFRLTALETAKGYESYGQVKVRIDEINGEKPFAKFKAQLYLEDASPDIKAGDSISGRFFAKIPVNSLDFNTYTYDKAKGIYLNLSHYNGSINIEHTEKPSLFILPKIFAEKIAGVFYQILPPKFAAFCTAITTGDKSSLDFCTKDALSKAGISHIIVVSGMHISIIIGFLFMILGRRTGSFFAILTVVFLMCMTGFSPSVVRAGIMNIMIIAAYLFKRQNDSLTAVMLSFVVIILCNPFAVLDVSCLLSFAATLGIILLSKRFKTAFYSVLPKSDKKIGKILVKIAKGALSILAVTLSANIATLPICAVFFGEISIISPLSNLLIVPVVSYLLVASFLLGILGIFSVGAASCVTFLVKPIVYYIIGICDFVKNIPLISFPVSSFCFFCALILIYIIIAYKAFYPKHISWMVVFIFSFSMAMMSIIFTVLTEFQRVTLSVLDTGGPAVAIRRGISCYLVDCGTDGKDKSAEKICNYLSNNGISKAEGLLITEVDAKHATAAKQLIENKAVKYLFIPAKIEDTLLAEEIVKAAKQNGVEIIQSVSGITAFGAEVNIMRVIGGQAAAEISCGGHSFLCAYNENIFGVYKSFALNSDKSFDFILTDAKSLKFKETFNLFCKKTKVKLVILPDRIYNDASFSVDTGFVMLDRSGQLDILIKTNSGER